MAGWSVGATGPSREKASSAVLAFFFSSANNEISACHEQKEPAVRYGAGSSLVRSFCKDRWGLGRHGYTSANLNLRELLMRSSLSIPVSDKKPQPRLCAKRR